MPKSKKNGYREECANYLVIAFENRKKRWDGTKSRKFLISSTIKYICTLLRFSIITLLWYLFFQLFDSAILRGVQFEPNTTIDQGFGKVEADSPRAGVVQQLFRPVHTRTNLPRALYYKTKWRNGYSLSHGIMSTLHPIFILKTLPNLFISFVSYYK